MQGSVSERRLYGPFAILEEEGLSEINDMDERTALLQKLVLEQHINVAERLALGAIAESGVARTLKNHFAASLYLPSKV